MTPKEFNEFRAKIEAIAESMMDSAQQDHVMVGSIITLVFTALERDELHLVAKCLARTAAQVMAGDA